MEFLRKNSENSCTELIEKNTKHMATLPTGVIGYLEYAVTKVKPPQ